MASPAIAGIDHIGVLVRDIDASIAYYTDLLGFRLLSDELTTASGGARLAYLDAGNIILQLVSPLTDSGPIADHLNAHGEGLHHLCLTVDDIDAAIATMAPGTNPPVTVGGRRRRTAFVPNRPNGLITELTESAPFVATENGEQR